MRGAVVPGLDRRAVALLGDSHARYARAVSADRFRNQLALRSRSQLRCERSRRGLSPGRFADRARARARPRDRVRALLLAVARRWISLGVKPPSEDDLRFLPEAQIVGDPRGGSPPRSARPRYARPLTPLSIPLTP